MRHRRRSRSLRKERDLHALVAGAPGECGRACAATLSSATTLVFWLSRRQPLLLRLRHLARGAIDTTGRDTYSIWVAGRHLKEWLFLSEDAQTLK
mmetsp:Transcript_28218/g.51962  ORF Transcript_28218/g.51962 Transcript_28218/m.51962 type:complete len:95 (-) Transcript_28218:862-1146(-)